MAIDVDNVTPKGRFTEDILFDITFECTVTIPTAIRWEVE
jgi:hypothetical protein